MNHRGFRFVCYNFVHFFIFLVGYSVGQIPTTLSSTQIADSGLQVLETCLLVERGSNLLYNYDASAGAIDLAVDYANEQILNPIGYMVRTRYRDIGSVCSPRNHVVGVAMDLRQRNISCDVYIGLGCAYNTEALYDMAAYYKTPIIGCPAAGVGTNADLSEYDYMTRISVTHTSIANTLLRFLRSRNYTTPVIVQDQDVSFYQQMSLVTESVFRTVDPKLATGALFYQIHSSTNSPTDFQNVFTTGMPRSRVFVLLADANTTRALMLSAFDVGVTKGDYVFFGVELFRSDYWGLFTYNGGDQQDGRDEDAKQAYGSLLVLALEQSVSTVFDVFQKQVVKVSAVRKTYSYAYNSTSQVDLIVSHFYDSILYYASVLSYAKTRLGESYRVENILDLVNSSFSFMSPVNGLVIFDDNGDRVFSYQLKTFNPSTGVFDVAFGISPTSVSVLGNLNWPGNRSSLPPNRPRCGFSGEDPVCAPQAMSKGALAAAVLIPLILILVGFGGGSVLMKRFINKNSDPFWWRIYTSEVSQITGAMAGSRSQSRALSGTKSRLKSQKNLGAEDATSISKPEPSVISGTESLSATYLLFTKMGFYRDNPVALRPLPEPLQRLTSALGSDLLPLRSLQHNNVQTFVAIAVNDENLCEFVLGEVCQKGSVMSLIDKRKLNLDWEFKSALIKDTVTGMTYLHGSTAGSHGDLSAHACLVDSRFVVKITDHCLQYFRDPQDFVPPDESDENRDFVKLLWRAPELLRRPNARGTLKGHLTLVFEPGSWAFRLRFLSTEKGLQTISVKGKFVRSCERLRKHLLDLDSSCSGYPRYTQLSRSCCAFAAQLGHSKKRPLCFSARTEQESVFSLTVLKLVQGEQPQVNFSGDVYSFSIVLQQLILRNGPFQSATDGGAYQSEEFAIRAKELVLEVKRGASPPQRPLVPISAAPSALHALMEQCWEEHPELRPAFPKIREVVVKSMGKSGENIVDHLIKRMEQYAAELEHDIEEKMKQFMEERQRSEAMLNGILPKSISDALRKGQMVHPETFSSTTVQFSDINGFAEVLSAAPTPFVTIEIMNTLYALCDKVIEGFAVYKVETVGDAYLLASGLPIRNGIKHAGEMATLALQLRKEVGGLIFASSPEKKMRLRVGINSGPCVASVIGLKMPKYCLFGDTVNTASRMESHGEPGKIQCSPTSKELLDKLGDYICMSRGEIQVKGKGLMETFWLVAKTSLN